MAPDQPDPMAAVTDAPTEPVTPLKRRFTELQQAGRKAFVPFITAGDPCLETTASCLVELDRVGATVIEVGIPYSDPIADGPIIQASYQRALDRKIRFDEILNTIGQVAPTLSAPVCLMVSYAIIHRIGLAAFLDRCQAHHIAGLIVPDLPIEEGAEATAAAKERSMSLVQLVTPTTSPERATRIASQSTGFLYYVSVAGVTGERRELPPQLLDNVAWLKSQTDVPILIGFGVSQPEHVRTLAAVADGVIVGSALVRKIDERSDASPQDIARAVGATAAELIAALP